jgi:mannose-6-phosphate isomerase
MSKQQPLGPLLFEPRLVERIWGGRRLQVMDPARRRHSNDPIGEAWLVSDHSSHASRVSSGRCEGSTLRTLVQSHADELLGRIPRLTPDGRFPLLLKLIQASQPLSVQVHPDDAAAARLGEADVGKSELWHVLEAEDDSTLFCGLKPGVDRDSFAGALAAGAAVPLLHVIQAQPGISVMIPAGAIHAIGAGVLIAEIQQNSDITYRLYDWDRTDDRGQPRSLHVDKGLQVSTFDGSPCLPAAPLAHVAHGQQQEVLAVSGHFAAERLLVDGLLQRPTRGDSFHLLLDTLGSCSVRLDADTVQLRPWDAVLVPGAAQEFFIEGEGAQLLDFYVPNLQEDIVRPLAQAGHSKEAVRALLH